MTARLRIQKYLSEQGVASRRAVEEMILHGRVRINGQSVAKLPSFVEPQTDDIRVDGKPIRPRRAAKVWYLLNKPRGVVCSPQDAQGRTPAADLVPPIAGLALCAGRLDPESTGLVILTNDGQLHQRITHARYGVTRTYVMQIDGQLSAEDLEAIRSTARAASQARQGRLKVLRRSAQSSLLEVSLAESQHRRVRSLLERRGHAIRRLKCTAIGNVTDRGLKIGSYRPLTSAEAGKLMRGDN